MKKDAEKQAYKLSLQNGLQIELTKWGSWEFISKTKFSMNWINYTVPVLKCGKFLTNIVKSQLKIHNKFPTYSKVTSKGENVFIFRQCRSTIQDFFEICIISIRIQQFNNFLLNRHVPVSRGRKPNFSHLN